MNPNDQSEQADEDLIEAWLNLQDAMRKYYRVLDRMSKVGKESLES